MAVAKHLILGVLRRGLPRGFSLVKCLDMEASNSYFKCDPFQITLEDLGRACSGFINVCETPSCNMIDMHTSIRAWLLSTNNWQIFCTEEELENAKYAEDCLEEIHSAFNNSTPSPDDATLEELFRQRLLLSYSVTYLGYHMEIAGKAINGRCDIINKIKRMHQYLPCVMQTRVAAAADKHHFSGYTQRYRQKPSLLWFPASEGLDFVLQQMLDIDGNFDLEERDMGGLTPLAAAALNGKLGAVEILIREKLNIEAKDLAGDTPLALAASQGHVEIVKALVSKGADVNVRSNDLSTTIAIAASNTNIPVCEVLLASGADWKSADMFGETTLTHFIRCCPHESFSTDYPRGGDWDAKDSPQTRAAMYRALFDSEFDNREDYKDGLVNEGEQSPPLAYIPGALRNRYILKNILGKGAFGICISAIDRLTGKTCAVKASQLYRSVDPECRARRYQSEQAELELLKGLKHQSVASLEGFVDANNDIFMISEKADGNLSEHLAKAKMSEDQIRDMSKQLLAGLKYMVSATFILK